MATLTVGQGEEYATIASAVAATQDGDVVLVNAGTYTNDFFTNYHKITLQSVGGMATILATAQPGNGKAAITVDNDLVLNGFGVTGVTVGDGNGAGIRYEAGNLDVENSAFWSNQDGILAATNQTGNIIINNSEFGFNGVGDGQTHNIYINVVNSLLVENSYFHDSQVGHEIKSRALNSTIIGNRIQDDRGDGSYDIDLPDGGNAVVANNTIVKGAYTENYTSIHYGGEGGPWANSSLSIFGNTLVSDNPNGRLILNQTNITASLTGNSIYGYAPNSIADGPVTQSGNTTLTTEPTINLATILPSTAAPLPRPGQVSASSSPNSPPTGPADLSLTTKLTNFGPNGAVVASGHILHVGAGQAFTSVGAAIAASQDGDTIQIAAGTYINDFGTVNHKIIIQGVGGMARLIENNVPTANYGILSINNDVTIENVEISGDATYNAHIAGLVINAGNVTLNNVLIDNNQLGISTTNNPLTTLSIYNSEITQNGNPDKEVSNIVINAIGSLTMVNDYVHNGRSGHEVVSHAYNTDIEDTRIIDGATGRSSFLLDLGYGGNITLKGDTFVKGPNAENGILVYIGGDGASWANSTASITGNTLINQYNNPDHPYIYFIREDVATTPVTATGNTFMGGILAPAYLDGSTITGSNNVVSTTATYDGTTSPLSNVFPSASNFLRATSQTLTLALNEDFHDVDAQFVVKLDGVAVGGGTVTAANGSPSQIFRFNGNWSPGAHAVEVDFVNGFNPTNFGAYDLYVQYIGLGNGAIAPATMISSTAPVFTSTIADTLTSADFDPAYYLAQHPALATTTTDPMQDYLTTGAKQGANPDSWFDTNYYLTQNPDVAASGINPLLHYETVGWQQGRDPSLAFSTSHYLNAYGDVKAAGVDPLAHYVQFGQGEGRSAFLQGGSEPANILVDTNYFDKQLGATIIPTGTAGAQQAMSNYDNGGWQKGLNPDAWFDTNYYLSHNPDVAAAHVDPLLHYETYGWKEGRDPSALFSTNKYLTTYADVKAAGADPLVHFVQYGQAEGRTAFAV